MKKLSLSGIALLAVLVGAEGCGTDERTPGILELQGDAANGSVLFEQNCVACHGADLQGTSQGPNISNEGGLSDSRVSDLILNGEDSMPPFADSLTDQEVADLIGYLRTQW